MKLKRLIAIFLIAVTGVVSFPVSTSAYTGANFTITINSVEVYRNAIEPLDQFYLIKWNIYNVTDTCNNLLAPGTMFIVSLSDGGVNTYGASVPVNAGTGANYWIAATVPFNYPTVTGLYFSAAQVAANGMGWGGGYTMKATVNPTLTWTNPPSTSSAAFQLWYDGTTVAATTSRLTTRMQSLALTTETEWNNNISTDAAYEFVQRVAGVTKLTQDGEYYFESSVPNLRQMCPDLFTSSTYTPDFSERGQASDYDTGGGDTFSTDFGANWFGQTFTASSSYTINGVWVKAYKLGAPGTFTASLRVTLAGVPSGADLCSGGITTTGMTTDTLGQWYFVGFTTGIALTSGTVYSIITRATAGDANNYVRWFRSSATTYANGQAASSVNSGAAWNALAGDFMFATTADDSTGMSYVKILEGRLLGTQFDFTAAAAQFGMSRMWFSTLLWLVLELLIAFAVVRFTNNFKPALLIILFMLPLGALAGFINLVIAIIATMIMGLIVVYAMFYNKGT